MADESEHPALKNFNEGVFTAKHVATKTVKGAGIGALAGAAVFGVGSLVFGGALLAALPFGLGAVAAGTAVATGTAGTAVAATLVPAVATGAVVGGVAGAGIGGVSGISGADEAVAAKKDELMAMADKMELRQQRREVMEAQRANMHAAAEAQAASLHVTPPQGLPTKGLDGQFLS